MQVGAEKAESCNCTFSLLNALRGGIFHFCQPEENFLKKGLRALAESISLHQLVLIHLKSKTAKLKDANRNAFKKCKYFLLSLFAPFSQFCFLPRNVLDKKCTN